MAEKIVKDSQGLAKELVNDCISRKAALDALEKSKEIYFDRQVIIGAMKDIVRNLPSAQPKSYREGYQAGVKDAQPEQRWIPCSERLPEEGKRVLATHLGGVNPNSQVIEHIYQRGKFTCGWDMDMNVDSPTFGQRYMGEVIAWMPLPEPYREEEQDG